MTVEFDTDPTKTNLHPVLGIPDAYSIQLSALMIKVTVKNAYGSSIRLLTNDGDFLDMDSTSTKNTQLTVSFHKPDAITGVTLTRLELLGNLLLEVRKVMHRKAEKKTFQVTVRR